MQSEFNVFLIIDKTSIILSRSFQDNKRVTERMVEKQVRSITNEICVCVCVCADKTKNQI